MRGILLKCMIFVRETKINCKQTANHSQKIEISGNGDEQIWWNGCRKIDAIDLLLYHF